MALAELDVERVAHINQALINQAGELRNSNTNLRTVLASLVGIGSILYARCK